MTGRRRARRVRQDVRRAEVLIALADGLSGDGGTEALRHRAAAAGVSVHDAARAVLSLAATDPPARSPRHLSVVPPREDGDGP